jgi:superfamily I DNA and/or RNA helicase
LQTDPAFDNLSIGVIAFYSAQVDLINELAEKKGYTEKLADGSYRTAIQYSRTQDGREKLRIGSVDSFQGKEFDVVILSTVRSNEIARVEGNESKVFGFLTLENRLNVAFSRAQKMIILVGDKDMFEDEYAASYVNGLYTFCTELTKREYGNRIQ